LAHLALKHEGKDATWENALEEYFGRLDNRHKDKKISFNTMDTTISTLKKHTSHWNKLWLSDFTSDKIESFINSEDLKKNEVEKVKAATRANILKFIRGVFKYMVDKGRMKHNPAMGIYIRGKKKLNYPDVMKHNDMIALIDYAKTVNPEWADVYTVAYLTGARSGELYSMKWENVNWDSRLLVIRESYDWKTEKHQPTKGKKDRTVPINLDLLECFLGLRGKYGEYILPRIQDWKNGKAAQIIRQFQKAIKIRPTKFHGIRGTFITNLLLQGVPVIKVQAMVGHDDLKTTLMYVGMLAEETKGATDVLTLKAVNNVVNLTDAEKRRMPVK
jgi:integrase